MTGANGGVITMLDTVKPLTAEDIEIDETYISVECWLDGTLAIRLITILGTPDEAGFVPCRVTYWDEHGEVSSETSYPMECIGVPCKPRKYPDNYHRLFDNSPELLAFLKEFVAEQLLKKWLMYIGIKDPDAAIAAQQAECEQFDDLCTFADGLDGDTATALFVANLERQRVDTVLH